MNTQPTTQDTKVVNQPANFHQKGAPQKSNLGKLAVLAVVALALSLNAFAAEADISVSVQSLSIIGTVTGGHLAAGNMEIQVKNGFTIPQGFTCTDSHYLTTRKSVDPDRAMFNMLLKAKTTQPFAGEPETWLVRITDNPALTAFPGRCSIEVVTLF